VKRVVAYLDTSALVKLYVEEDGEDRVVALLDAVHGAATSVIAYAEARAVFARYLRKGNIDRTQHHIVIQRFNEDWNDINEIDVTPNVYRRAGDLLTAHAHLRAMDAIHLASAIEARTQVNIKFLTFDDDLELVARAMLASQEMA